MNLQAKAAQQVVPGPFIPSGADFRLRVKAAAIALEEAVSTAEQFPAGAAE